MGVVGQDWFCWFLVFGFFLKEQEYGSECC